MLPSQRSGGLITPRGGVTPTREGLDTTCDPPLLASEGDTLRSANLPPRISLQLQPGFAGDDGRDSGTAKSPGSPFFPD